MANLTFKIFTLIVSMLLPVGVFAAVQTGGGYIINGQVNPVGGVVSGGGYSSQVGGSPISVEASGSGYTTYGGSYFTPAPEVVTTPTPSGGGGGGGGGSVPITPPPVASGGCQVDKTFAALVALTPVGYAPCRVDPFPDGTIDVLDFNVLMVGWSKTVGDPIAKLCNDKITADINCDGAVDILDFNLLMVYWGKPVFNYQTIGI